MFQRLPMYQHVGADAFKKNLFNIISFSEFLGNPHKDFKAVHVAGTNGKGSTSHMLASILQEAGYKVGLYTSPHLTDFRERIKINGKEISENEVVTFIDSNKSYLENNKLSFFEMTVGMAFSYFSKKKVDIAVIEVGLGGRLDSTNIINPILSIITNIGLDHTDMLGNTLAEIAAEKAGIIKPNTPVVIGEFQEETFPVFQKIAKNRSAEIVVASKETIELETDLKGDYQKKNSKTTYVAVQLLQSKGFKVSSDNIRRGLSSVVANTGLQGRWQQIHEHPKAICDTAHNKEGLKYVISQLERESYKQLHMVLGFVSDKKLEDVLALFPVDANYYFCKPNIPRGLDEEILFKQTLQFGLKGNTYKSVKQAYQAALCNANKEDLIFIGGSTFVVAAVLKADFLDI
ncbi:bifunctional folylpolyglutamate synthase/dihydrofolate synthase [Gillisia sp. Hel_I_86]|uniref:bifunctional folylpolyglutamate synthase/dihydrofolate synthase n=1 Tax=Gillisia sp. Hel_I_86 TaxID=1249981 RepID=UPI0011AADC69|nr:folylpolyglutamate synthase/dihydrofolate synthase family protein [Gillisia sp. Hel_I_86]